MAGAFPLLPPEAHRAVHPSPQQRRQAAVGAEPAAQDHDAVPFAPGPVARREQAADHGAGQHALEIDKGGGVDILQRGMQPRLPLRPAEEAGEQPDAQRLARDQAEGDQQAEHILHAEALMTQQRDVAGGHRHGEGGDEGHGHRHEKAARVLDDTVDGEHGRLAGVHQVRRGGLEHREKADRREQAEARVIDRVQPVEGRPAAAEEVPAHHQADRQPEECHRGQHRPVAGVVAVQLVIDRVEAPHAQLGHHDGLLADIHIQPGFARLQRGDRHNEEGAAPLRRIQAHHALRLLLEAHFLRLPDAGRQPEPHVQLVPGQQPAHHAKENQRRCDRGDLSERLFHSRISSATTGVPSSSSTTVMRTASGPVSCTQRTPV